MQELCKTCGGKGTINNPTITGSINYNGLNGETCPQVICKTCGGSGWITHQAVAMTNPFIMAEWDKTIHYLEENEEFTKNRKEIK